MVLPCRPRKPSSVFFFFFFFFCITFTALCEVHEGRVTRNAASAADQQSCIPLAYKDATILAQLKNAVVDPLDHLSTWQYSSNVSACTASSAAASSINSSCAYTANSSTGKQLPWLGVTCGRLHGRITGLNLASMNLSGPFPTASIARLKFLRLLNLSSNSFHGSFPADLANCTHLQIMDLSANSELGGSIPREWGRLSRLQELVVVDTALSGSIPVELANCSELLWLFLANTELLSGSIPAELGALGKLKYLDLVDLPGLTGRIPASLANCSALIALNLHMNGLRGNIPAELGRLAQLQDLLLVGNSLTGVIPAALANCSRLSLLQVAYNGLSGHIPPELGSVAGLTNLHIGGNYVVGSIPPSLGNCSALATIALFNNGLTGSIPAELAKLPLVLINFRFNNLTGEVSSSMIANLTSLNYMDLGYNQLNGTLQFLSQLKSPTPLFYLNLGGNPLRGQIPDVFDRFPALQKVGLNSLSASAPQPLPRSFRSLQSLTHLSLRASNFQGSIPSNLVTSLQLQKFYLSSNNLSGTIPGSLGGFPAMYFLDLSHNSLSGEVPLELGSLFELQYLNLSRNKLSGRLPSTLANCAQLISLNVSTNHLTGPLLPLPDLTDLKVLDLSYNNFTGPIPNALPFSNASSTTTNIMLNGNPGLCGTLVQRKCKSAPSPMLVHHVRSAIKFIGIVLGTILLALLLVTFGFIILWKKKKKKKRQQRGYTFQTSKRPYAGIHLIHTSITELREATSGFNTDHILGTGAVSTVYHAILSTGKAVAVKVFNNEVALANETAFKKEVAILAKLRHRNIVRVLGCCFHLELKAILLELMPNGSLDRHLYNNYGSNSPPQQQLTGMQKLRILVGVAQGLEYLHHHHPDGPIVHCDLKPHNILLDACFEACITDFGIATMLKEAGSDESVSHLLRGSIGYIPPVMDFESLDSPVRTLHHGSPSEVVLATPDDRPNMRGIKRLARERKLPATLCTNKQLKPTDLNYTHYLDSLRTLIVDNDAWGIKKLHDDLKESSNAIVSTNSRIDAANKQIEINQELFLEFIENFQNEALERSAMSLRESKDQVNKLQMVVGDLHNEVASLRTTVNRMNAMMIKAFGNSPSKNYHPFGNTLQGGPSGVGFHIASNYVENGQVCDSHAPMANHGPYLNSSFGGSNHQGHI